MIHALGLDDLVRHHDLLPDQDGLTVHKFADGVEPVVGDDEKIVIPVLIAAHETGAVLVRTIQFGHVRFDAHVAEVARRRGPEVHLPAAHEDAIPAAVIVHDAAVVEHAVPAGGVVGKVLLIQNIARCAGLDGFRRPGRQAGGEDQDKKEIRDV
ncbi:MAG: hypothetical protein MZV64_59310 [Ignavibacteriales bacterium]|nr:hypothetical protein [Ignavibacteriales bacterium]